MKANVEMRLASPVMIALVLATVVRLNAGDLNPPAGPVAPTQRTPITPNTTPGDADSIFRITVAGSYYLVGNVAGVASKSCIEVDVATPGAVTIDLSGFQIIGTGASLPGVFVAEAGNTTPVTIRNGRIHGGNYGIRALAATSSVIEDVHVTGSTNGIFCGVNALVRNCTVRQVASTAGILVGGNSIVENCISEGNSADGIRTDRSCIVRDCVANNNTGNGITPFFADRLTVERCVCTGNGGNGIQVDDYGVVRQCTAAGNTLDGIEAQDGCTITECSATQNAQDGIEVSDRCRIADNLCDSNGLPSAGSGIQAVGQRNRVEGNEVRGNNRGLDIDGANNSVRANTVVGNTDNYDIAAGNQLEILLGQIPESIDWPATVRLAGNLTGVSGPNGITVNASEVTIDLAGHSLVGVAGSGAGITVPVAVKNLAIMNGTVRGWGSTGIFASNAVGVRVENVRVSDNTGDGLLVGDGSVVTNCIAVDNTVDGIATSDGCTVIGCAMFSNGQDGIDAATSCTISVCTANGNSEDGIEASSGSSVRHCTSDANGSDGIEVVTDSHVADNTCDSNGTGASGGAGIRVISVDNRIEGNQCTDTDRGIEVNVSGNIIIRNTCSGNGTNWDIAANNVFGPIIDRTAPASPAVLGDSAADSTGSTHPNANFTY